MKTGQIITNKLTGNEYTILEVLESVVCVESPGGIVHWHTKSDITKHSDLPVEKWEPKIREKYHYVYEDGSVDWNTWRNYPIDNKRKDFLGIFKTAKEAEARLEEINGFLKK